MWDKFSGLLFDHKIDIIKVYKGMCGRWTGMSSAAIIKIHTWAILFLKLFNEAFCFFILFWSQERFLCIKVSAACVL